MAHDDCKPSALPKHGYSYCLESDDGGRIHHPDERDTVFATFFAPTAKRGKPPPNRESCQQRIHVSYLMSLFEIGNETFSLIVTLN